MHGLKRARWTCFIFVVMCLWDDPARGICARRAQGQGLVGRQSRGHQLAHGIPPCDGGRNGADVWGECHWKRHLASGDRWEREGEVRLLGDVGILQTSAASPQNAEDDWGRDEKEKGLFGALHLRGGGGGVRDEGSKGSSKGGGSRVTVTAGKRRTSTTTMELDEDEDEKKVKGRARAGIILEEELDPPRSDTSKVTHTPKIGIGEPIPRRHAHANKVVREDPGREKKKKLEVWEDDAMEEDPIVLQDSKIGKKSKQAVSKKAIINCTLATAHGLFNVTEFAEFLQQRIKVNGKMGKRQTAVTVRLAGDNIVVTTPHATQLKRHRTWSRKLTLADAFSTRYLKYLTKKFICKSELRDVIRCVSTDFSLASRSKGGKGQSFEIRYTNVWKQRTLRVKFGQMYGTRMEAARRDILESATAHLDNQKLQLETFDQLMERKIKATGERVGGIEYVNKHRKTLGEVKKDSDELLKHWVALQKRTYRAPFAGQFRGHTDRSICRHDP